jgi:hypothetical protein
MNKVNSVRANDDFSLVLCFDDGSVKRFEVDIAFGTVRWPHEQDISAETLYIEGTVVSG